MLDSNTELRLVESFSDVKDMFSWFENTESKCLGLDTETSGLKIYNKDFRLRMVQIGDELNGWAVPYQGWGGAALELIQDWDSRSGQWTLHNASYDAKVLLEHANYQIPWHNVHDTMIMSRILFPDQPADLKTATDRYVDPRASSGQAALKKEFKDNGWDWDTIPINNKVYSFYSALDPVLAIHLYNVLYPQVMEVPDVYDLEMSCLRILTHAEVTGMRIDLDYVQSKVDEFTKTVAEREQYAQTQWNLNINSGPQLIERFTELEANFSVFTPKGAKSVNQEQLDRFLESSNDQVRELSEYITGTRKTAKMNSSYFMNFLEMEQDGILHPNINTMAARTGRMSVTNPALQTLHSNDSIVRNSFLTRHDGDVLVSCDYSQVEARLLAHLSGDEKLAQAFISADASGGDFFVNVGRMVYNDPDFQKSDPRRKLMKGLIYGASYGASVPKMAKTAGVPLDEMEEAADSLFTEFPGIKKYMAKTVALGQHREQNEGTAYIYLDSGRKLVAEPGKPYALTNYSIQGLAAELTKKAIVRLDAAGLTKYILMPVHDEVIFSIPEDLVEELLPVIEDCMSFVDGEFLVPLPAGPEIIGDRWGRAYE